MKIAFFDAILESHVPESLERALRARGHQVISTGKIGHGFEFVRGQAQLAMLQRNLGEILEQNPDWILVYRPASLPAPLLRRLKRSGANLAVWLSDDPVLYDLTYGPVLDDYDLVLHCGKVEVLEFYERQFGRPTGVNMPFWTDHVAFPAVWGAEPADADYLFLGNVHDEVRRDRYFDLAKLPGEVALYGQAGRDYFGISRGYLDSDAEVVGAGSRALSAINVPQFFSNHRGLKTWFPGLGELGFFEYPSRVVQYMAMGLPVFSVIPGRPRFDTFPEMYVAEDFAEVGLVLEERKSDGSLGEWSKETLRRFERHFSAESRALMLEDLFTRDDWRHCDARERTSWFTRYDPTLVDSVGASDLLAEGPADDRDVAQIQSRDSVSATIGIFGFGWTRAASRVSTLSRAAANAQMGLRRLNPSQHGRALVPDPNKVCSHALNVSSFGAALDGVDILLVAGVEAALTAAGQGFLAERGVKTVFVDDSGSTGRKRIEALCRRYDLVAFGSEETYSFAKGLGLTNVWFMPPSVDGMFLEKLVKLPDAHRALRWFHDKNHEQAAFPAAGEDLSISGQQWAELEALNLDELAEAVKCELAVISFGGNSKTPVPAETVPFVLAGSAWTAMARHTAPTAVSHLGPIAIQAKEPGELAKKLVALGDGSSFWGRDLQSRRATALESLLRAEAQLQTLTGLLQRSVTTVSSAASSPGVLSAGEPISIGALAGRAGTGALELCFSARGAALVAPDSCKVVVRSGSAVVWSSPLSMLPGKLVVTWSSHAQRDALTLELVSPEAGFVGGAASAEFSSCSRSMSMIGLQPGVHVLES